MRCARTRTNWTVLLKLSDDSAAYHQNESESDDLSLLTHQYQNLFLQPMGGVTHPRRSQLTIVYL